MSDLAKKYPPRVERPGQPLSGPPVLVRPAKPPKKRKEMKRVNRERAARAREEDFSAQSRLCRLFACCVCGKAAPSEPHHYPPRARGGKDDACSPVCRRCHELADGKAALRGVSFAVVASYMADQLREHVCVREPDPKHEGRERCYVCREPLAPEGTP